MAGLRKKRRIQLIIAGFAFLGLATVLIGYAFKDGIQYFRSPTQVLADQPTPRETFKMGGLVKGGSFVKNGETAVFVITDTNVDVAVSYTGILPDLFKEGQGTIVTGSWRMMFLSPLKFWPSMMKTIFQKKSQTRSRRKACLKRTVNKHILMS